MRTLLVLTVPRCAEKLQPLVPRLAAKGSVDVYMLGEMSPKTEWYGDHDIRSVFINRNRDNLFRIIHGPGYPKWGDLQVGKDAFKEIDFENYDIVIVDDNRIEAHLGFYTMAQKCKKYGVTLFGTPHANGNSPHVPASSLDLYDYIFCYGELDYEVYKTQHSMAPSRMLIGGYPSTDRIWEKKGDDKHILVVLNLLGFRAKGTWGIEEVADKEFMNTLGLEKLQDKLQVPIVFKVKSRFDEKENHGKSWSDSHHYVSDLAGDLDHEVITDVYDDCSLLLHSKLTISCSPTLALKSIATLNPTFFLRTAGMPGNLGSYPCAYDPRRIDLYDEWKHFSPRAVSLFRRKAIGNFGTDRYMLHINSIHAANT